MKKSFVALALCGCSLAGFGQANKNTRDSLKEVNLEEITISVTRFKENKNYLPQQILSISSAKIAFYNQPTTAELLTQSGAVNVQKSQLGGGSPVIRGFEANKIIITVDGIRMNNAIYRGGHLQNVITLDNAMLDKTEVLYGPSSVIYGSDALGGVLSFYSKNPQLRDTTRSNKPYYAANAFLRYASAYNEKAAHADFNIGGKKLASLTSISIADYGDLRQGSNHYKDFPEWGKRLFYVKRINGIDSMIKNANPDKQVQTGYRQYDLLQKFLLKTGKIEQVFNFQYSTSSDVPRYDRLTQTNAAGVARSAEWYYGPQERFLAAWHIKLPLTSIYDKAQITTAYQAIEESRHNRNFKSTQLNHRVENVKIGSLNADFFKAIKQNEVNYGGEITYNDISSAAFAENIITGATKPIDTRYPDGGSNTQSYALYATVMHKFSARIIANGGLRYTHNRLFSQFNDKSFFPFPYNEIEQNSNALAGNASLVLLPGKNWKLSLLASSGFRTPNVDDISKVFESGNGTVIIPNPAIKPEKTMNYEIGISKKVPQIFQSGVTVWYTNFTNILTTDFTQFNGSSFIDYNGTTSRVVTTVNKNTAYSYGISANISADLGEHISAASVINYTYGRIKEQPQNYPLDHIPPVYGKTNVTGRFGKFTGELFALYNGKKDSTQYNLRGEDNESYSADAIKGFTPAWATINFRSSFAVSKLLSVQFAIENIWDKYYRVFASGLSAPGRNFVMTLRGSF